MLAKHSESFSLIDYISVGVDRMQRIFEPMREQVDAWQRTELTDVTAKVVIYKAFVEGKLEAPKNLARTVHDLCFEPKYEEFGPRTIWSLSNAFTSAFKEQGPISQFWATAKLGSLWKPGSRNRSDLTWYRLDRHLFNDTFLTCKAFGDFNRSHKPSRTIVACSFLDIESQWWTSLELSESTVAYAYLLPTCGYPLQCSGKNLAVK